MASVETSYKFGRLSFKCFVLGSTIFLTPQVGLFSDILGYVAENYLWLLLFLHALIVNGVLKYSFDGMNYEVSSCTYRAPEIREIPMFVYLQDTLKSRDIAKPFT